MADSAAFEAACKELERSAGLDSLVARGTIRIVLKDAGLDARTVTPSELTVAIEQLLPCELASRGVDEPDAVCAMITTALGRIDAGGGGQTPDQVFARLGGSS